MRRELDWRRSFATVCGASDDGTMYEQDGIRYDHAGMEVGAKPLIPTSDKVDEEQYRADNPRGFGVGGFGDGGFGGAREEPPEEEPHAGMPIHNMSMSQLRAHYRQITGEGPPVMKKEKLKELIQAEIVSRDAAKLF